MASLPSTRLSPALSWFLRLGLTALLAVTCAGALAQDVRLVAKDSDIVLDGALLGFDGEHFRIDTIYGPLTVNAAGVICKGAACPKPGSHIPTILMSGDRYMAREILPRLIEGFAAQSGLEISQTTPSEDRLSVRLTREFTIGRIELHATSTAESYADLITEDADIALVTRPPREIELNMSKSSGSGDLLAGRRAHVLAVDAIALMGSDELHNQGLTLQEFISITSQGDLDGRPELLVLREGASLMETVQTGASVIAARRVTEAELIEAIETRPNALGVLRQSAIVDGPAVRLSDACGGLSLPDPFELHSGDYPLTARMMLYTAPRRLPEVGRNFLRYLGTKEAREIVAGLGHRPPEFQLAEFDHLGQRLAHAVSRVDGMTALEDLKRFTDAMVDRRRLSATFRFLGDSTELDMGSRDLLRRLADSDHAGQSLTLAGFSASGPQSFRTSQRLIETVRKELRKFGIDDTRSLPLGNVMPALCDDGALGSYMNRRVEVWLD